MTVFFLFYWKKFFRIQINHSDENEKKFLFQAAQNVPVINKKVNFSSFLHKIFAG
jgi:hypothetical protein